MSASRKTFAYGTLEVNGDTWFLVGRNQFTLLDIEDADFSLDHKTVSIVGTMGIPASAPGITKLIVERIASHEAIEKRAYQIYESGQPGSADDHWIHAERALLGIEEHGLGAAAAG